MSNLQAILFNKNMFTMHQAKMWLRSHDYKPISVRDTKNLYRFRLKEPHKNDKYRIIHFGNGIEAVADYGHEKKY